MQFSIIVPVYNGHKYIKYCLESVAKQDFGDYELIVVDDGSTDGSVSIANDFAATHPNVQVMQGANQGPFFARRRGLSLSRGTYAVFLDADDALAPHSLMRISEEIDATKADIISFRSSRSPDFSAADDAALQSGLYINKNFNDVKRIVLSANYNNLWGKAVRISCIDLGVAYESSTKFMFAEDLLQLLPVVDRASSLDQIDDVLYYYRQNDSSSTGTYKHWYLSNTDAVASKLLEYGARWEMPSVATAGAATLYVNVLRLLIRYGSRNQIKDELPLVAESLRMIPNIKSAVRNWRPDLRMLLEGAIEGDIRRVTFAVRFTDLARRFVGRQ